MGATWVMLLAACAAFAQDAAFERVQRQAALLETAPPEKPAARLTELHLALRDWIESRLPESAASTGDLEFLLDRLTAELHAAGLIPPETADGRPGQGYIEVKFRRLPELYDTLFVVAGASVECGTDEAVYLYHWDAGGRKRVLEDRPATEWQNTGAELELSDPDSQGRRLLAVHYTSVQCASNWQGMTYSVYRLSAQSDAAERLFSGDHDFWLGDDGPEFVLKPDELIMQFLDRSVDDVVFYRTEIHRYSFADGVRRLDPVALQPQDFAEEWLARPWSEMQSRSAAGTEEWHERLHAGLIFADYQDVVPCIARPGRWLIGMEIRNNGDKEWKPPLEAWFVVGDPGDYHYRMESVSESRPQGCPGTGPPSDKHPVLSPTQLRSLK